MDWRVSIYSASGSQVEGKPASGPVVIVIRIPPGIDPTLTLWLQRSHDTHAFCVPSSVACSVIVVPDRTTSAASISPDKNLFARPSMHNAATLLSGSITPVSIAHFRSLIVVLLDVYQTIMKGSMQWIYL